MSKAAKPRPASPQKKPGGDIETKYIEKVTKGNLKKYEQKANEFKYADFLGPNIQHIFLDTLKRHQYSPNKQMKEERWIEALERMGQGFEAFGDSGGVLSGQRNEEGGLRWDPVSYVYFVRNEERGPDHDIVIKKKNELRMKTAKLEQLKADLAMFDQQNNIKSILGKNYEDESANRIFGSKEEEIYPKSLDAMKDSLTLKISGEQNRLLLNKVRPSYYGKKDENTQISSMGGKTTGSKMASISGSRMMQHSLTADNAEIARAKNDKGKKAMENPLMQNIHATLGEEDFDKLRDLFEKYAAFANPLKLHSMESHQFRKFMKENNMYSDICTKVKIDLLFQQKNKAKSIDFLRFCEILLKMGKMTFPVMETEIYALERFLRETVFSRENKNFIVKNSLFTDWMIELENPEILEYLETQKSMLVNLFKKYGNQEINYGGTLGMNEFIHFAQDIKITPHLLSNAECAKMFKAAQRGTGMHSDSVEYHQFVEAICFLGFGYYSRDDSKKKASTFLDKAKGICKWIAQHI